MPGDGKMSPSGAGRSPAGPGSGAGRISWIASMLMVLSAGLAAGFELDGVLLSAKPEIDGVLDEAVWSEAAVVEGFVQFKPQFGQPSPYRTVVLAGFTQDALYVAFRCFDPEPGEISAAVTSRDGPLEHDDSVSLLLDTFHDRRTAYYFITNSRAVQGDGKVADNGRVVEDEWDGTWKCASSRSAGGWTAEFEIPFEILRFSGGADATWGINFHRYVPRDFEVSVWAGPGESQWRVSTFGELTGLAIRSAGAKKFAVIPYGLAVAEKGREPVFEAGVDVRLRLATGLSADLTLNPDFALVEADVEQINLTRFELFVPEKRPFFLEGLEMFDQRIRQFYSRRIGDITWGGKLIGSIAGFDVAAIASAADLPSDPGDMVGDTADYAVVRVQRGISGGSTVGLLAANRGTDSDQAGSIGLDTTLYFTKTLGLTAQLLRSHGPEFDGALGWFLRPAYDSANSHFHLRYTDLDPGLKENVNVIGFLADDDRREFDTEVEHVFWFEDSAFERLEGKINYNRYWSQDGVLRSWALEADAELVLTSFWQVELAYEDAYELFEREFRNSLTSLQVGYDNRSGKSFAVEVGTGKNFDSDVLLATAEVGLNLFSALDLEYEGTWLELDPDPENESTWIHVFRAKYHFTNDLFVNLFWQTNSVIHKENIQLLGVWRFLPPFGSLQVAYQRGTSEIGTPSDQGDSLFTKLQWVF